MNSMDINMGMPSYENDARQDKLMAPKWDLRPSFRGKRGKKRVSNHWHGMQL
jgi:hypothetical protein